MFKNLSACTMYRGLREKIYACFKGEKKKKMDDIQPNNETIDRKQKTTTTLKHIYVKGCSEGNLRQDKKPFKCNKMIWDSP